MTIVITYLSEKPVQGRGNAKSRRKAMRAAKTEQVRVDRALERKIVKSALNLTERTAKVVSMPTFKSKEPESSICCLPEIALFAVNAEKPERITAR